jgi:hypothetical protein
MAGLLSLASSGKLTPQAIQAQMHLNPQQAQQLQRIVLAGQKIMFSKQSHKLLLDQLNGPGTMSMKIGQGVAGLMGLLLKESNNSLPPNLIIPAGMILVAHAAEFLRKAGAEVTDQDIGQAVKIMVTAILHAGGVNADKVAAMGAAGPKKAPMAKAGVPA